MKKIYVPILILAILGMLIWKYQIVNSKIQVNSKYQIIKIGAEQLRVEIAKTPDELSLGLGERDAIGSDGMLFVLPMRIIPTFWMKGMRFSLDFVWINEGKVVALTPNIPFESGVSDAKLQTYSSGVLADTVLELPSGEVAKRGLHVGDTVY